MEKIAIVRKAVSDLERVDIDVSALKVELEKLEKRDKKASAFRDVLVLPEDVSNYATWDKLPEHDREHYRTVLEKYEKFFDEWEGEEASDLAVGDFIRYGDDMPRHLKYKDTDGDVWYWNTNDQSWCYIGRSSGGVCGYYDNFDDGHTLFPMEVVS